MGAGVRKYKILPSVFLAAAALVVLKTAYTPETVFSVPSSSDHGYWHDFWNQGDTPAEIRIPGDKLPASFPGPLDAWAGGKSRSIVMIFDAEPGEYTLLLENYDAHEAAPPLISFTLNGARLSEKRLQPGDGLPPPYGRINRQLSVTLPVEINEQENILVLRTEEGSWAAPARLSLIAERQFSSTNLGIGFLAKPRPFGAASALFLAFLFTLPPVKNKENSRRIAAGVLVGLSLYLVFSVYRENLVPAGADFERSLVLFGGDEPAYLMTAQAIARGDGLDVRETHKKGLHRIFWDRSITTFPSFTWDWYERRGIRRILDRSSWWEDKQILSRPPLLPLLISPLNPFEGNPRWKSVFFLSVLTSLSAAGVFFLAADEKKRKSQFLQAAFVVLYLGAVPAAYYTAVIFPEIIAGALLLLALAFLSRGSRGAALAGTALLFVSLWSTQRVLGGVAAATAFLFFTALKRKDRRLASVVISGWAIYFFYHFFIWGLPFIPNVHPESKMDFSLLPVGTMRFFFSRDVGLFFLSPVSAAGLAAGVYLLKKKRTEIDILWGLLFAGLVLPLACFPDYRAGTCPAGRFQVIPAFTLLFPLLRISSNAERRNSGFPPVTLPALFFGAAGFAMSMFLTSKPGFWFRPYHPIFGYERMQPYYRLLPDFGVPGWHVSMLAWLFVFGALGICAEYSPVLVKRLTQRAKKPGSHKKRRGG